MPPSPSPAGSPSRPSLPRLYAIVDVDVCARSGLAPFDVVRSYLSAGVRLLQLRAKSWDSGRFLDLAQASVDEATRAAAIVVVNDRADIAALSAAPGLHVGQDDLAPVDARKMVGASTLVGLSTHTEEQWTAALDMPIDYLAIGPVFGTETKATGYRAVGLDTVGRVAAAAGARSLPVVAIGGITLENAASVIDAGGSAVAVISDLLNGSPEARARAFIQLLA